MYYKECTSVGQENVDVACTTLPPFTYLGLMPTHAPGGSGHNARIGSSDNRCERCRLSLLLLLLVLVLVLLLVVLVLVLVLVTVLILVLVLVLVLVLLYHAGNSTTCSATRPAWKNKISDTDAQALSTELVEFGIAGAAAEPPS